MRQNESSKKEERRNKNYCVIDIVTDLILDGGVFVPI